MEERFGKDNVDHRNGGAEEEETSSSSSEDEDDDGILAAGVLDDEVNATLRAIRSKDPRVYDTKTTFYTVPEDGAEDSDAQEKKEKPMYLQDYHRRNLLAGHAGSDDEDAEPTYAQQQENLKRDIVREMHDAAADAKSDDEDEEEDFMVAKEKPRAPAGERTKSTFTTDEVEQANADPDRFLSKYMDSRAWVQQPGPALHPFESDDDDEEERAELIEEAYNFRFEDPEKANEKLISHARDAAARYSVRKDQATKRQRARETETEKRNEEKQERKLEKARLRKLRIEEAQEKLQRIKDAAGSKADALRVDDWQELLTADWDEGRFETEMQEKFGDAYYAQQSDLESEDGETRRKKPKKPKWNDDIDITDLVPNFDGNDEEAQFSLSSEGSGDEQLPTEPKSHKKQKKDKATAREQKRKERRQIEQLVDANLDMNLATGDNDSGRPGPHFRYRETSPSSFGMTSKDILFASDSQLNQFAGLKKLAAFRDSEKKRKDKKRLNKKARLREWRKETFGSTKGPRKTLQDFLREELEGKEGPATSEAEATKRKKRKRSDKGVV